MVKVSLQGTFQPVRRDAEAVRERGLTRARSLLPIFGIEPAALRGRRILEIGCGFGETSAAIMELFGSDVVAVDVSDLFLSGPFKNEQFFRQIDATSQDMMALGEFDYMLSFDCFEHVENPSKLFTNIRNMLRVGGRAFFRFNLYRGPSASHLTSYLHFPWCHLIHSAAEIRYMMQEKHGRDIGPAWVNKLTHLHYIDLIQKNKLIIDKHWYREVDMDPDFYQRYKEKLKCYPVEDLQKDFMHVSIFKQD